ncbi:hypothetical protein ONK27_25820, partial [Salmonella enterica subsp. enterica serovar Virginia]|nr:hypothetical protein [Salmonella enterica subsp. enterica serovar Virginia]
NTLLIFINQIRMKIGVMFGNPETTTGGNALKFYASVRLDIRRRGLALQRIAQFVAHIRQHGFNDARIPRHDITGHHVVMTSGEIAD